MLIGSITAGVLLGSSYLRCRLAIIYIMRQTYSSKSLASRRPTDGSRTVSDHINYLFPRWSIVSKSGVSSGLGGYTITYIAHASKDRHKVEVGFARLVLICRNVFGAGVRASIHVTVLSHGSGC